MKKLIFTLTLLLLGLTTGWAQDERPSYSLWPANQPGTTENINVSNTWDSDVQKEIIESSDGTYYKITCNGNTTWPCFSLADSNFDYNKVFYNSYDLVFDIRSNVQFDAYNKIEIKSAAADEFGFSFDHNGEWQTVHINLNDHESVLNSYKGNESSEVFLFYIIAKNPAGGNTPSDVSFDVTNIRLVPNDDTPIKDPSENPDVPNPSGGAVFSGSESHSFTQGDNVFPYTLNYTITYLEDKTLNIKANFEWQDNNTPTGLVDNMYVIIDGHQYTTNWKDGEITTSETYIGGEIVPIIFKVEVTGAAITPEIQYVVGSSTESSDVPVTNLVFNASVDNITMNSAEISYSYELPDEYEGATVSVSLAGDVVSEEREGVFYLTDLTERTSYSVTLTATATLEGKDDLTKEVTVEFTTLRDPSKEIHNYQIVNGFLEKAHKYGEDISMNRNIPVTMISDITIGGDGHLIIDFKISGKDDVDGFIAEIGIEDEWSGDLAPLEDNDTYRYTSKNSYEMSPTIFYWLKYAGGVTRMNFDTVDLLEGNDPVEYGEPVDVILTTDKNELIANTPQAFCAYLVDENGNFLLDLNPTLTIKDETTEVDITGDFITLKGQGEATLVASYNGLETEQKFVVLHSEAAVNLAYEIEPTGCDHADDLKKATDGISGDTNNCMTFLCTDGEEEHSMMIDLGKECNIEVINLAWEGACAQEYSIILSKDGETPIASYMIKDEFGGSGLTVRRTIHVNNINARYVQLLTAKAYNIGWNIKLEEIEVYGTEAPQWDNIPCDTKDNFDNKEYVIPVYSNHYDFVELPQFEGRGTISKISAVGSSKKSVKAKVDADGNDEILLFENLSVEENTSVSINRDVTGAEFLNMSIYSQTTGQITISAVWEYEGLVADTQELKYVIDVKTANDWIAVSIPVEDIGYNTKIPNTDYNGITTIGKLNFASNIPTFTIDNCYFVGSSPLSVDAIEAAEGEAVYYTLQGVRVANPEKGIFIKVQNGKATKVVK